MRYAIAGSLAEGTGMSMQMISVMALAAVPALWTASDPFVGTWKLDVSRSTILDRMVVENAGLNRYTFRFEGGPAETILANGTDQPGIPGTTLSVTAQGSRTMSVVRKQAGRTVVSAHWKLSQDGKTLHDAFTSTQPGSSSTTNYVYRRMSGTSGFSGAWESTTKPNGLNVEQQIRPYGKSALSFVSRGIVKNITFDGQDHALAGAKEGTIASGRRESVRAMEYTEKNNGKIVATRTLTLSTDGKKLTITVQPAGQSTPNTLVFARE